MLAVGAACLMLPACGRAGHGKASPASGSGTTAVSTAAPSDAATNPAGDIPDTQAYVPYQSALAHFRVKVPEGWSRRSVADGASFTDKLNTVSVTERTAATAPSVSSVRSTELPTLQAAPHFGLRSITTVSRPAGSAVLIAFTADSSPDPVTGKVVRDAVERYEFWRHGIEIVLSLSGPVGADNVDPWRTITDSFTWV
jgi:hypothetical protein